MRVKFFIFIFMFFFVFSVFSAVNTNSGSGSMGKPSVKFKEWQVGRSPKRTDTTSKEQKSFITSTEEECYFTATVGYDGNQGDNVSPIDPAKVTWSVENQSHGMALADGSLKHNWSGDSHPSKLAANTSFNVVGKLTVPEHIGTSKSHCPNYGGANTPLNGRADTPMTFTIKFSAKTEDGQSIEPVRLVLIQDEKDEMRQEYMDLAGKTDWKWKKINGTYQKFKDGNVLRVPPRSAFKTQNTYDDGHYSLMMGRDILPDKHTDWTDAFKEHAKKKFGNTEAPNLVKTGGYRNPHHHYYHVGGSENPRSWHQFGLALDVRGKDIDINKDNQKGTLTDRKEMAIAAELYASESWTKHTYDDKHVHAQWEFEGSNKERASTPSAGKFSLPPQGTDTAVIVTPAPAPMPSYHACGVHLSTVSGDHSYGKLTCGAHSDYKCLELQKDRTYISSCTETNSSGNTCNNSSGYYECKPHTHTYASGGLVSCKRKHCDIMLSSAYGHSVICKGCGHRYWTCPTAAGRKHHAWVSACQSRSNGNLCSNSSGYYKCSPHSHTYPSSNNNNGNPNPPPPPPPSSVSCGRSACTASVSSANEHRVGPCSACGSGYWTCGSVCCVFCEPSSCSDVSAFGLR